MGSDSVKLSKGLCEVASCGRRKFSQSFCWAHWRRLRKRGDVLAHVPIGASMEKGHINTPKARVSPTTSDLNWIAGFLEGEGSFGCYSKTQKVTAFQNEFEPLSRLQKFLGGKVHTKKDRFAKGFVWTVHGERARGVMMTLYSLMSPRRQGQIKKALCS